MEQSQVNNGASNSEELENFTVCRFNSRTHIHKYLGHEKHVIIPEIAGVTSIMTGAFAKNTDIEVLDFTQITCENYAIQKGAFRECVNLKTILFPKSGVQIHFYPQAFVGCIGLADENGLIIIGDTLYGTIRKKEEVYKIIVPQNVRKIAANAFRDYNRISTVVIPDSVEEIGSNAFWHTALEEVELSQGLKRIGPASFGFTNLKKVRIPRSVEVARGFSSCDALREVIIENGPSCLDDFGWNPALKKIEIPESIHEIPDGAFFCCKALKTIVIKASECTLDPNMLFSDREEEKKSKIQIQCCEQVAEAAPENLKRFCVVNGQKKSESGAAGTADTGSLYGTLEQFDIKKMIRKIAPGCTFDNLIFPKSATKKIKYEDKTISVKLRLQKLSKVCEEIEDGQNYAFYTALENMLSKDEVVALIEREDPEYISDEALYARPKVDPDAPTAERRAAKRGFMFLVYIAFCLTNADVLHEVVAAMPRKKDGTFYKGRLLRIACTGFVKSESIPQIYAKADEDDAITISAACKSISEEELRKFEKDFVSTHQDLFRLQEYRKKA